MPKKDLKIIFIGDINGKIGRETIKKEIPGIKKKYAPDLIIANADNIAHGKGATENTVKELMKYGIEFFTSGDHCFDQLNSIKDVYNDMLPTIRPLNYSVKAPGKGYDIINTPKGDVLVINLIGRVFMRRDYECPFILCEDLIKKLENIKFSAIIIDIHAEATSEKIALKHYFDGKVSAILGTHTHVMTADETISAKGTAYISDVGMTGAADGILGVDKENIIESFITQIKAPHVIPVKGKSIMNCVLITVDSKSSKALKIESIIKKVTIN